MEKPMSTERNGIEKDYGWITPGGGGGSLTYTPIF